jgi:hypothetical protein
VITCPVDSMWQNRSTTVGKFGLDQTDIIKYCFNSQGFRSQVDYDFVPDYAIFGCSIVFGIGVDQKDTIAGQFDSVHNYGLAGNYNNTDCYNVIEQFVNSKWYTPHTKMAVIWTHRDQEILPQYIEKLQKYHMIHFFCGDCPDLPGCYKFISNLDHDVSLSHPGPKTHRFIHQSLCQLFDRS